MTPLALNIAGLAAQTAGALLLGTSFVKLLLRAKPYGEHYQEFWDKFIANRGDFEDEALRYSLGTVGVSRDDDLTRKVAEAQFARAKLRVLDLLVADRLGHDAKFARFGVYGAALLLVGFILQLVAFLRDPSRASGALTLGGLSIDLAGTLFVVVPETVDAAKRLVERFQARMAGRDDPDSFARAQDREAEREWFRSDGPSPISEEDYMALRDIQEYADAMRGEEQTPEAKVGEFSADAWRAEQRIIRQLDAIAEAERRGARRNLAAFGATAAGFGAQLAGMLRG